MLDGDSLSRQQYDSELFSGVGVGISGVDISGIGIGVLGFDVSGFWGVSV